MGARTRILVGWDTGVAVYLAAVWVVMARSDIPRIRRRAALMDEGRVVFLILTAGASLASLGGIVVELGFKEAVYPHLRLALSAMTIVLSWAFIHVITLQRLQNRLRVGVQWMWSYFTFTHGVRLITGSDNLPGWQPEKSDTAEAVPVPIDAASPGARQAS